MIRVVMVSNVAKQQAGIGSVYDQPQVAIHPNRPEPAILGLIELVELQTRLSRVQLEVEGGCLYGFLLIALSFARLPVKVSAMRNSIMPSFLDQ